MTNLAHYELDELKLIYRVLHRNLMEHIELMDSRLFGELQGMLQSIATHEGVDVTHHKQWDAWLGQTHVPCAIRMDGRQTLN